MARLVIGMGRVEEWSDKEEDNLISIPNITVTLVLIFAI